MSDSIDLDAKEIYYCRECGFLSFYPILRPFQEIINCKSCDSLKVILVEEKEVKK